LSYSPCSLEATWHVFRDTAHEIYESVGRTIQSELVTVDQALTSLREEQQTSPARLQSFLRQRDELKNSRSYLMDKLEIVRVYDQVGTVFTPQSLTLPSLDALCRGRYHEHRPDNQGGCAHAECLPGASAARV
jgi:hypothetical protein